MRRAPLAGWLADRGVRTKNLLALLVLAAVALGIGVLSINRMGQLDDDLTTMKRAHLDSMGQLVVIREATAENYRGLMLTWGQQFNPSYAALGRKTITEGDARMDGALAAYDVSAAGSPARHQALAAFRKALTDYRQMRAVVEFRETAPAGFTLPALADLPRVYTGLESAMNDALAELQRLETAEAETMAARAQQRYEAARWWTAGSLTVGLGLALLFALWLSRMMGRQLSSVAVTLAAVADGDLSGHAEVHGRDELGDMAAAVNRANAKITDLMQRLEVQEERFRSLVQHASDITAVIDPRGRLTYASPAVKRMLGIEPETTIGLPALLAVHPDDRRAVRRGLSELVTQPGGVRSWEIRVRRADGSWRWLAVVGTNLTDLPSVGGVVCNARDITDLREVQDRLRYDATHDPLTGLANRALFQERLHAATTATVLLLDLDDFKPVNDELGHHVGDELLIAVAERLRGCVRGTDTVARLGGDEFALLLPADLTDTGPHQGDLMAARILDAFAEPARTSAGPLTIKASIGVATGRTTDHSELLRRADEAMYLAKRDGKNSFASAGH
ncbi:diguanylate cyclase domain-containing protein [Actinoplanes sp. NPDC051859]|uniref:diguanylate cyclase domain-containing protein n=1 Tax=Actinoplanes sp. NPDC051859 TaxID=3363909 RepID=UPI00379061AC